MAITTRARVALLVAVVAVLIAGIAGGSRPATAGASEDDGGGSTPQSHGGVAGACVAPEPGVEVHCDDTVGAPALDPDDGAQLVEPTPGMADVRAHLFDHAVVGDDGTSVTVFFWSGVEPCYVLDHVDVGYATDSITITLFEGHDASAGDVACIEIALLKKVVVGLDEPVGDRRIVDGAA